MGNPKMQNEQGTHVVYVTFDHAELTELYKQLFSLVLDRTCMVTLVTFKPGFQQTFTDEVMQQIANRKNCIFVIEEGSMMLRLYRALVAALLTHSDTTNHVFVATLDAHVMQDPESGKPRYPEGLHPFIFKRDEEGTRALIAKIREISTTK